MLWATLLISRQIWLSCPQMPLTDTAIRNAKPGPKPRRLADGGGLTLSIRPNGTKAWRFRFRFRGKEQQLSAGIYPDVSLQQARQLRDEYRRLIATGVNPSDKRKAGRAVTVDSTSVSFETVACEWFAKERPNWSEKYARNVSTRLERYVFPTLGERSIADVGAPNLLAMLDLIQKRGTYDTAQRVQRYSSQILDYAIVRGHITHNPAPPVKAALTKPKPKHFAAVTDPKDIGKLLSMLHAYEESLVVMSALRLAPLVFVRPGELRKAKWADMKLDAAEPQWEYLVTKTQTDHIVPLSEQAVAILRALHPHTRHQPYVFPGTRNNGRPMSENTLGVALRTIGVPKEEMSVHGFRAMARTCLDEQLGFPPHLIEHQLAHAMKDPLGRSYNRTTHLPERKKMMQAWADYLDRLRTEATG